MHFETVRLMLALAALENWYITGLDVQSAYLYGKLNEEIYPEGLLSLGKSAKCSAFGMPSMVSNRPA